MLADEAPRFPTANLDVDDKSCPRCVLQITLELVILLRVLLE
jgi:hypothetical protein